MDNTCLLKSKFRKEIIFSVYTLTGLIDVFLHSLCSAAADFFDLTYHKMTNKCIL